MEPKRLLHWYVLGTKATPPPDLFKKLLVKKLQKQFGLKSFVETGTYKGDMTAAARQVFDRVYSIELHLPFYEKAIARFAGDSAITIIHGHSRDVLPQLLLSMNEPTLFWLDAHGGQSAQLADGSEEPAPVLSELEAILSHSRHDQHVVLVDDVHTFLRNVKWGVGVWEKIEGRRKQWLAEHPDWVWQTEDNILRIYKRRSYESASA